jgi:guanosine-3',5'-bis(diphosphate) 3'-pyrophosphohydrolase
MGCHLLWGSRHHDLAALIASIRTEIHDPVGTANPGRPARIDLRVELASAAQLRTTMDQIRSMADVLDLARTGIG